MHNIAVTIDHILCNKFTGNFNFIETVAMTNSHPACIRSFTVRAVFKHLF